MSPRRVAVLGGGPGGLYAARLLRLAAPGVEVVVHEQASPETTFGFGVALAGRTQANLEATDPDTLRELLAVSRPHDMQMQVGPDVTRVQGNRVVGIARTELLAVLTRYADKAGVALRYGERLDASDLDADIVIAADGVSSAARTALADRLDARVDVGRGLYLWAGADFALEHAVFAPVTTEHGTFVTHAYPYSADRSTFLVEVDEDTWRRAGFDATTAATASDASDETALDYLSDVFAEQLRGHRLLGNRTRWLRFRTVACRRWSYGNVVLLGDAVHTAHYSIGSGTKLAMEDAIALCRALTTEPDRDTALLRYQAERKPAVERMQALARRSQCWWDSFPSRTGLPVDQLTVAYMTRAGNVPLERFAASTPDVARAGLAEYGQVPPTQVDLGAPVDWTLRQPLVHGDAEFAHRVVERDRFRLDAGAPRDGRLPLSLVDRIPDDPWGPEADTLVDRLRAELADGSCGVWVTGPDDRDSLLTRLDVAERLRLTGALVVTEGPEPLVADLAAGLAGGRTDLIAVKEES